jgi:ubiquinone/menaquinone biosynthesis C-methylase UbiE
MRSTLDVVICSLVLHYVEHWEDTLNEFHRILRKGGKCLVSTNYPITDYKHFNKE